MSNSPFAPLAYPRLGVEPLGPAAQAEAAGYAEGLRRAAAHEEASRLARAEALEAERRSREERIGSALTALGQAVARLDARQAPLLSEVDRTLARAALDLAEAVLGREVADGRTGAEDALRRIFAAVPAGRVLTVHLNPADLATLREGMAADDGQADSVRYVTDPALEPGDATAELQHGWLDARIASALERAREVLGVGL